MFHNIDERMFSIVIYWLLCEMHLQGHGRRHFARFGVATALKDKCNICRRRAAPHVRRGSSTAHIKSSSVVSRHRTDTNNLKWITIFDTLDSTIFHHFFLSLCFCSASTSVQQVEINDNYYVFMRRKSSYHFFSISLLWLMQKINHKRLMLMTHYVTIINMIQSHNNNNVSQKVNFFFHSISFSFSHFSSISKTNCWQNSFFSLVLLFADICREQIRQKNELSEVFGKMNYYYYDYLFYFRRDVRMLVAQQRNVWMNMR